MGKIARKNLVFAGIFFLIKQKMLSFVCLMERFENKAAIALVAVCASGTMIAGILDPASLVHAQGTLPLLGIYIFTNADPAIVANFYRNFFRIAWNSIL